MRFCRIMLNRKPGCAAELEEKGEDRENYLARTPAKGDWVKKLESRSRSCDVIKGTLERRKFFCLFIAGNERSCLNLGGGGGGGLYNILDDSRDLIYTTM